MTTSESIWYPESWKNKTRAHDIDYDKHPKAPPVLAKLCALPPLVSVQEIQELREQLKDVANGKRFILQGGDCAELFDYCTSKHIEDKLKILFEMSSLLAEAKGVPIVLLARIAGQFAKPRTTDTEVIEGSTFLTFRGDNINGAELSDRTPDPDRLLSAYFHSSATLNYIRSLLSSTDFVKQCRISLPPKDVQINGKGPQTFASFHISHEGLTLDYETCLTRQHGAFFYNQSAHFVWLGDKTRQLFRGHVEYFRGLANPIGIKISSTVSSGDLPKLLQKVNPKREEGKVVLITRYGVEKIQTYLPLHINAVQDHPVIWCVDPMHGNTVKLENGLKTRRFDTIFQEILFAFQIHRKMGTRLGGVHFELTGEEVTECTGGSIDVQDSDLSRNYQTKCDPRLSYSQSLDMAQSICKLFQSQ